MALEPEGGAESVDADLGKKVAALEQQIAQLTPRPEAVSRDSKKEEHLQAALEKNQEQHKAALAEVAQLRQVLSNARLVEDDTERLRLLSAVPDSAHADDEDDGALRGPPKAPANRKLREAT